MTSTFPLIVVLASRGTRTRRVREIRFSLELRVRLDRAKLEWILLDKYMEVAASLYGEGVQEEERGGEGLRTQNSRGGVKKKTLSRSFLGRSGERVGRASSFTTLPGGVQRRCSEGDEAAA